jgi:hypothetical protein
MPFWARAGLGTLAGGLVIALGFDLYQRLLLDDLIEPSVSIPSGLLFVLGFAISVGLPPLAQVLLGAAGVAAAYLIPWSNYLINDVRPPFIFDYDYPESAAPLAIIAALVLAVLTLGYLWRKPLWRAVTRAGLVGLDPLARLLIRRQPS